MSQFQSQSLYYLFNPNLFQEKYVSPTKMVILKTMPASKDPGNMSQMTQSMKAVLIPTAKQVASGAPPSLILMAGG